MSHVAGLTVKDLYALVRACEGLRDNFRKVIIANLKSWAGERSGSEK
jgi:hypothetical protein